MQRSGCMAAQPLNALSVSSSWQWKRSNSPQVTPPPMFSVALPAADCSMC